MGAAVRFEDPGENQTADRNVTMQIWHAEARSENTLTTKNTRNCARSALPFFVLFVV